MPPNSSILAHTPETNRIPVMTPAITSATAPRSASGASGGMTSPSSSMIAWTTAMVTPPVTNARPTDDHEPCSMETTPFSRYRTSSWKPSQTGLPV